MFQDVYSSIIISLADIPSGSIFHFSFFLLPFSSSLSLFLSPLSSDSFSPPLPLSLSSNSSSLSFSLSLSSLSSNSSFSLSKQKGWYHDLSSNTHISEFDSLAAFWPGMQTLLGDIALAEKTMSSSFVFFVFCFLFYFYFIFILFLFIFIFIFIIIFKSLFSLSL